MRWWFKRQCDDLFDPTGFNRLRAGRARLVIQKSVNTLDHETLLPTPDTGLGLAGGCHNRVGAKTIGTGHDDPGAPDALLR